MQTIERLRSVPFLIVHRKLVSRCIDDLLPERSFIYEELPSTTRVTLTETRENLLVHIKATFPELRGNREEHQVIPAGAKIIVNGIYSNGAILPGTPTNDICNPANLKTSNGKTIILLPQIKGYCVIALTKQKC